MDTRWRRRPRRLDPRVADALVALGLFVLLVLSFGVAVRAGQRPVDAWAWVLGILMTAPYAVHRRAPWLALTVTLLALVAFSLLHYAPYPGVSAFALLFGLALHGRRRDSLLALGATVGAFCLAIAAQPAGVVSPSDVISTLLATAVAWLAGDNLRQRRLRWAAIEERARLLEREREDRDRAAVTAERLRIARELHDVVAHSMSVIAVQAGVGSHVIATDPTAARDALAVIESTSRGALTEMRRMLGVLRQDGETAMHPMPGLADIPRLVAETRRTGVGVTVSSTGDGASLPAGLDLAAYRVVQEALTNVLKHGGPVAHVHIACSEETVDLEVLDEGPARRPRRGDVPESDVGVAPGAGQGLVGMRERVELYGGSFEAGPRPGGGFRVHATLPYAVQTP
jgi:signal transduction histidine kinase